MPKPEKPRKKRRVCDRCSSQKRTCSGTQPCHRCARAQADCHFSLMRKRKTRVVPKLIHVDFCASNATGLVHTQQHQFLKSFVYSVSGLVPLDAGPVLSAYLLVDQTTPHGPSREPVDMEASLLPPAARSACISALAQAAAALGCLALGACRDHVQHMVIAHGHSQRVLSILLAMAKDGGSVGGSAHGSEASFYDGASSLSERTLSPPPLDGLPAEIEGLLCIYYMMESVYYSQTGDNEAYAEASRSACETYLAAAPSLRSETRELLLPSMQYVFYDVKWRTGEFTTLEEEKSVALCEDEEESKPFLDSTPAHLVRAISRIPSSPPATATPNTIMRIVSWLMYHCRSLRGPSLIVDDDLTDGADIPPSHGEQLQRQELAYWCFVTSLQRLRSTGQGAILVYISHAVLVGATLMMEPQQELIGELVTTTNAILGVMRETPGLWPVLAVPALYAELCGWTQNKTAYDQILSHWQLCQKGCGHQLQELPGYDELNDQTAHFENPHLRWSMELNRRFFESSSSSETDG